MNQPYPNIIYKIIITSLFVFYFNLHGNSQCACTNCPVTLPNSGTAEGFLTISGASSGTLNATQFVKAVNINVDHDALRECEITLIAPNGSSVLLSDNSGIAVNNNISYDICILDCTGSPVPDPGFPINFTSNANYMTGQTYTGSYFTYNGGCLSTLTGPVDGQWTLRFQDFIGGDGGTLNDWSIELADNAGTSCTFACATPSSCLANGTLANIPQNQIYCEGSPNLDFNLTITSNPPLDPNEYSTTFLLQNTVTQTTLEYDPNQNFTDLPPGQYSICGLVYLTTDGPSLPPINGTNLIPVIQQLIDDDIICAAFALLNCWTFEVEEALDLPITIEGPEIVCAGQLVTYTIINPYGNDVDPTVGITMGGFGFFQIVGDQVNVIWLSGPGTICVSAENSCGMVEDCIDINVNEYIYDPTILGNPIVCFGDIETYQLIPSLPIDYTISWEVTNGSFINIMDNEVTVSWGNGPSGQVCAFILNPCNQMTNICFDVVITQPAPPPNITLPSSACIGSNFLATLNDANLYETINWTVNPGSILSGQGSGQITVNPTSLGTITICVDVTSECSPPQTICQDLQIIDPPSPTIAIITQCGLSSNLTASFPNFSSTYIWTQISGPGTISFNPPNGATTDITATLPGAYIIQLSETLNGCTGVNTIAVTLQPNLLVSSPTFDCNNANGYTVSFTINGGLAPYTVDNNAIIGNSFTSSLIPFGSDYNFIINDSEDCEIILSGSQDCPCVSDAGVSSSQLIEVCEDQLAVGSLATSTFLDFNDIGFYVLHDNPGTILGSIFSSNVVPEFIFIPTLQYGVTYYISYVVGNNLGGTVDLSDPCLSISLGQPIVFNQIPSPNAGIDLQVCGNTFTLNGSNSVNGSTTTWNVISSGNIDIDFPDLLNTQVMVDGNGIYQFLLEENNQGCVNEDIVEVEVFDALTTQITSVDCDPLDGGYTVTFGISGGQAPYIVNGDPIVGNTYTSSLISSGTAYNFDIVDGINCFTALQGIFNCDCTTQGGTMSATEQIICAEGGSVNAIYNSDGILDGDDVGMYVLHTSANNILGTVLATNQTGIFSYQSSFNLNTRYYISYVIGNNLNGNVDLSDICLGVSPGQPVIFRGNPLVNINPVSDTCGLTNIVSINPQSGTNYVWSTMSNNISFANQNSFQTLVSGTTFGTYDVSLIASNDVCSDTSTFNITFNQAVSFGPIAYECQDVTSYETTIPIIGTAPFTSSISSTEVTPNQLQFENLPSGVSTQVIITSINGCVDSTNLTFNCACQSTAGTMSNNLLSACEGESVVAEYNFDGILGEVDSFIYILHTSPTTTLGTILATSADGSFTKSSNIDFGTIYYISYVSVNYDNGNYVIQPCSFVTAGQPVVFYQNPTLTWDVIVAPCALSADFVYSSTDNITNFDLTLVPPDAFAVVNILGILSDKPGIYTATLDVEGNGCVTTFTKTFELFDAPIVNNLITECNGLEFSTSFEITGGTAPYFLNGDTPITSPYVSDNFASLTNFSFFVEDNRGCTTPLIVETIECLCITDAGSLNSGNITLCEGDDLSPTLIENFTLDSGDSFEYILHDGDINSIGNILVRTKTFPIPYDPSFAGDTFILTRIVGQSDQNGEINIASECSDFTTGIQVNWTSKPGIAISLEEYTCEESPIFFNISNPIGGLLEVSINQSIVADFGYVDGRLVLINDNLKNGDLLTYTFTDNFGCTYDVGSDVLDIRNKPNAGTDDQSFATCNNIAITVNLDDFISFADKGGQWYLRDFTNPIPAILNLEDSIKANFKVYYTVNNECGSDTSTVEGIRLPLPEFELGITDPLCFGQSDGTINIIPLDLTQNVDYSLDGTPLDNLTIENLPAGQFTILAVNSFTCRVEQMIDLIPPVAFDIDLGLDITIDQGETIEVDFTSNLAFEDILSTTWTLPNGEIITEKLPGISFIGDVSGQLSLEIIDNNGCSAQDSLQIKVNEITTEIVLPNIILPGSTTNGLFTITNNTAIAEVTTCAIYDRWGNNVYSIDKVLPELVVWDGSFKSADCQPGVYVYKIALKLINGKEKVLAGDITILR
jgi:subtilisin-like proprotein convertase family protein